MDVGTTRTKALVLDGDGNQQGFAAVATPFVDGQMEVGAFEAALRSVVAQLGPLRSMVEAVGIAGMAESGAPLVGGRAISPVLAWFDPRGQETVDRLHERFGDGLDLRIGQRLRTVSSVAKLGWLLDHGLPVPHRWLGVPELCLFFLTGSEATEWSLAARTGALDVGTRQWMPEVLALLGLPVTVFPEIQPAGAVMGRVRAGFGLPERIPVTLAGHDHLAGAESFGWTPYHLLNSVGTAETLLRRCDQLPDMNRALELRVAVTLRPGGEGWVVIAGAGRPGLVEATLHERVAGAVEAAARLTALLGPPDRLIVYGGGSLDREWMDAKAARFGGLPVLRSAVADATARGAALAAGVAAGWWPDVASAPLTPLA